MDNVPVFVEAKIEYTKQLVNILQGNIYIGIKSIYEDSVKISQDSGKDNEVLVSLIVVFITSFGSKAVNL